MALRMQLKKVILGLTERATGMDRQRQRDSLSSWQSQQKSYRMFMWNFM